MPIWRFFVLTLWRAGSPSPGFPTCVQLATLSIGNDGGELPPARSSAMQASQVIPFQFEAREVRTCVINDQPWFAAQDILNSFDYAKTSKSSKAMSHVPEQWREVYPIHTLGDAQNFSCCPSKGFTSSLAAPTNPKRYHFKCGLLAKSSPPSESMVATKSPPTKFVFASLVSHNCHESVRIAP